MINYYSSFMFSVCLLLLVLLSGEVKAETVMDIYASTFNINEDFDKTYNSLNKDLQKGSAINRNTEYKKSRNQCLFERKAYGACIGGVIGIMAVSIFHSQIFKNQPFLIKGHEGLQIFVEGISLGILIGAKVANERSLEECSKCCE